MMRIVQINSVCGVGSTGRIAAELARKDLEEGNEVLVVYGRGKSNLQDIETYKIGTTFNVYSHAIKSYLFDGQGLGSYIATKKLVKKLESFKPDRLHIHNLHGYYINIEVLFEYIKKTNIEVVWTLHDLWSITGHCAWDETFNCVQYKTGCKECKHKMEYPKCILHSFSERNFKIKKKAFTDVPNLQLIAPSQWIADVISTSFMSNYPISVVHNTIDKKVFKPVESDFREKNGLNGKHLLLCVAFAWPKPKYDDLIKISNLLNDNEVLVLVGLGKREFEQLKENKKVFCIRRTDSREELAEIYSSCNVFINPTYADNYPTVNLEAEACGLPVVCYDSGGCKETIHLAQSRCVNRGDLEALIQAARKIIR